MEANKTFRIIVIVTVSTLVTILSPVESKYGDSYVARSLLHVFPPSGSPAPAPAVTDIDSPAASPQAPTAPEEIDIDSPAQAPSDSMSPAEVDLDSPASSPESPAYSNPPSEESYDVETSSSSPTSLSGIDVLSSAKNLVNPALLSPEIKAICGKTDFPPLCESSVSPLLTVAQLKPDTSSVLVLAIQASINATKAALATVKEVAADDCQELYDDALANLEDAALAVKSRDIATVNTNLSAAMTDYSTCNDGFEEAGEPNPLADVGDKLTKMVSNCLAISTLLK
ncbi:hypothetical protein CARUB_v10014334mg [Capsella rubella]|uniref:Pectinesterase inhibitor domain-containing protein n=1 Tax=Capsella rubella TaxID=81985 RepID=R0I4B5_9BRAS|nr:pectinesterase inhibitor 6 [Capsella rubella]EOA31168.1 hypothetical protein CARUB_v10014334mg [Capsella rubella]